MHAKYLGFLTLGVSAFYGCAPISRESCINDSSYDIGHAAAMDNANRQDRQLKVSKICGKQGREIDEAGYSAGFVEGTKAFCVADFGYQWGAAGRSYNGICKSGTFSAAYEDGFSVYLIEKRRTDIRSRLTGIRDRLAVIGWALDESTTLTDKRKRELLNEVDRLLLERSDLLAEQSGLPLPI